MAGLSGIVKKISDLVTGTPADDDCFIFGKTDLKKITLAKLKDALGITSLNSALDNYLRRYAYTMANSENSINFILPSSVSGYAYLPFLIIIANNIAVINVTGSAVGSSLSENGVVTSIIVGSGITAEAIKESGKVRIKCRSAQVSAPVSIIPLREGIKIESAYTSYTP